MVSLHCRRLFDFQNELNQMRMHLDVLQERHPRVEDS
jgi:hypothetical protein